MPSLSSPVMGLFSAPDAMRSGAFPRSVDASGSACRNEVSASELRRNIVRGASQEDRNKRAYLHKARLQNEALKTEAVKILKWSGHKSERTVSYCGNSSIQNGSVSLILNTETKRARFGNVMTCGNVWLCPNCSKRIAKIRAEECNGALAGARKAGFSVFLVTFTARHFRSTDLASMLKALKAAKQRFARCKAYSRLPLIGSITATEVTHGSNGFHPHLHSLVILDCNEIEGMKLLKRMSSNWLDALAAEGLSGGKAAFDVRNGSAAGDYVAKNWKAGEELALGSEKVGRNGGRTPEQILRDAADGCSRSAAIWAEYARVFAGKRQLFWSRGLKDRFGINDLTDEEAAALDDAGSNKVIVRVFSPSEWQIARRRKASLLRAAERGANLDAALAGPPDWKVWRRLAGDRWER